MDIIEIVTVFLGLTLLWMGLLYCEERKHDKQQRVRMALIEANNPHKPIHIKV